MNEEKPKNKVLIIALAIGGSLLAICAIIAIISGIVAVNRQVNGQPSTEPEVTPSNTASSASPIPDDNIPILSTGTLNTGNLTETGNGYEGTKGTGKYNYGEALQKSLLFYELQRSGKLPENVRCNWRGDSCLGDGSDVGLDLTGGWFDAGDHVKFNLPMSYTSSILGWSVLEDYDAYLESGQINYALSNIRWANEYFIKCHPEDEVYYYQVGDGGSDHSFWGPAEVADLKTNRPSHCVTKDAPGSAVCAETAASLAIASIVFKDEDPEFSSECLSHAQSLYKFADKYKSDAGYTAAAGFYDSWSGFYDELSWAGAWLYKATGDKAFLTAAESNFDLANQDFDWAMCWDDVHIGAAVILARETGNSKYTGAVEKHLDYWTTGTSDGSRITYTPQGLAWLDSWGSLRYATTTAFIACTYSEYDCCTSSKKETYWDFGLSQADYALGDTGRSFLIGYGDNPPGHPHHRTAQGSYCNNMNEPSDFRHTLYGALVGGPDASDGYNDTVSDYTVNEVACDYNAGFTGLMAKLYSRYKGQTLIDFGAVETVSAPEIFAETGINVEGNDFVEIKAYIYNESAWPARASSNLEYRYFVDLSEIINAGGNASNIEVSTNYMQSGRCDGLKVWDESQNLYYLSIVFDDGKLFPGGQENYKQEIQVRMKSLSGVWDNSNDPSYDGATPGTVKTSYQTALYEDGKLIFGSEPGQTGSNAGASVSTLSPTAKATPSPSKAPNSPSTSFASDRVSLKAEYNNSNSSVSGTYTIKNLTSNAIKLSDFKLNYFFTSDGVSDYVFECYHSAINGKSGSYTAISSCSGTITSASGTDTDSKLTIIIDDKTVLESGDELTINFALHPKDWSTINTSNDYSGQSVDHITIESGSSVIFGTAP